MFQHTAARRRLPKYRKSHVAPPFKFQHTAARRRLQVEYIDASDFYEFQHTAARRRLLKFTNKRLDGIKVSTHSRPKAAA